MSGLSTQQWISTVTKLRADARERADDPSTPASERHWLGAVEDMCDLLLRIMSIDSTSLDQLLDRAALQALEATE